MKILFCKITNMKYYKGVCDKDEPKFGGKFVDENGYGHEELNFFPVQLDDADYPECVGFVEPKSNGYTRNTIHVERLSGCSGLKNAPFAEDVLVVWCTKRENGNLSVVGWYKHATVWRDLQEWTLEFENGEEEDRCYNIKAKADDCTLLPQNVRNTNDWSVPMARKTKSFGFGQSMIWYADTPEAEKYVNTLVNSIENYSGENWIDVYPE